MAREADVVEFNRLFINVPRRMIQRCFWKKEHLTAKETSKLRAKSQEIKKMLKKFEQLDSAVDICLLKADGTKKDF